MTDLEHDRYPLGRFQRWAHRRTAAAITVDRRCRTRAGRFPCARGAPDGSAARDPLSTGRVDDPAGCASRARQSHEFVRANETCRHRSGSTENQRVRRGSVGRTARCASAACFRLARSSRRFAWPLGALLAPAVRRRLQPLVHSSRIRSVSALRLAGVIRMARTPSRRAYPPRCDDRDKSRWS